MWLDDSNCARCLMFSWSGDENCEEYQDSRCLIWDSNQTSHTYKTSLIAWTVLLSLSPLDGSLRSDRCQSVKSRGFVLRQYSATSVISLQFLRRSVYSLPRCLLYRSWISFTWATKEDVVVFTLKQAVQLKLQSLTCVLKVPQSALGRHTGYPDIFSMAR